MNIAKFLRTPTLKNIWERLLLDLNFYPWFFLTNVKIVVIITLKTLAIFRIESIPNKKAQKLFLEPENSCSYHIFSSETIIYKKNHPKFRYVWPREDTNNDFRTIWYLHKTSLSSHSEVFLGKGVLKICSKFTGEHPCWSAICKTTLLKSHFGMGVLL